MRAVPSDAMLEAGPSPVLMASKLSAYSSGDMDRQLRAQHRAAKRRGGAMDRRHFLAAAGAPTVLPCDDMWCGSASSTGGGIRGFLRRLTKPGAGDNRATFMPDGAMLLFASKRSGRSQIWGMDPDGAGPRQIHESTGNDYGRVAVNSDATQFCYSSDRDGQSTEGSICAFDLA